MVHEGCELGGVCEVEAVKWSMWGGVCDHEVEVVMWGLRLQMWSLVVRLRAGEDPP